MFALTAESRIGHERRSVMQRVRDMTTTAKSLVSISGAGGFSGERLHSTTFFGRHAFEVKTYGVLHDFPFGAVLMLRNRFEKGFSGGAHREQLARIVPDAVRLAFLAETFRRASSSLLRIFHVHDYVISQKH